MRVLNDQVMTPVEQLRAAKTVFEGGLWERGVFATDANRTVLDTDELHLAKNFCALGALYYVTGKPRALTEAEALLALAVQELAPTVVGYNTVTAFNDHIAETKEEVVALFDRAIELASLGPVSTVGAKFISAGWAVVK